MITKASNSKFSLQTINDTKVKPVIVNSSISDPNQVQGGSLVPNPYSNIYIVAKKNSGKTTVIYNLLKNCSNKDTKIIFFVSTIFKDKTYSKILKMLDKKDIEYETYEDMVDPETNENLLTVIMDQLRSDHDIENSDSEDEYKTIPIIKNGINFGHTREIKIKKKKVNEKKKKKKVAPEVILVFDDLGASMRTPILCQLLKIHRHLKSMVIMSSQSITDLQPQSIKQLDICLVFKSLNPKKIKDLYEHLDLGNIEFDDFKDMYQLATSEKYNFLYINARTEQFRKNFNKEIVYNLDKQINTENEENKENDSE